jgi:nicotinamidase-related amidase
VDPQLAPHWNTAALVVIDVQRDFLSESPHGVPGTTEMLPRLRELVVAFRAARRPIIYVIRLYAPDGSDADRARRTLLAGGARIVAPGSAGREIAPGLLPEDARATLIEASERDYRIALATDALSQVSDQGLREVAGIGTVLLTTEAIRDGLRA